MELIRQLFDTLVHLSPASVNTLAHQVGPWLYAILFGIIFAETGLVATPFLPGDSLLFAVGAVAAAPGSPINLGLLCLLLIVAAVAGDAINYAIGTYLGPKVFAREDSWLLNRKHLLEAHAFYERYGGVTIILARFMPIIRTFAPFVAGIGRMTYARFAVVQHHGRYCLGASLLAGWVAVRGIGNRSEELPSGDHRHHRHLGPASVRALPPHSTGARSQSTVQRARRGGRRAGPRLKSRSRKRKARHGSQSVR